MALIVAIASALFVGIKEGLGLTLEYRESETTQKRKKEIDEKLREEIQKKMKTFMEKAISDKENEEIFNNIEELGYFSHIARTITDRILDNMHRQLTMALRNLGILLYVLFFTVLFGATLPIFESIQLLLMVSVLGITSAVSCNWMIRNLQMHYFLRRKFVELYENPNLDHCEELCDELIEKNLW